MSQNTNETEVNEVATNEVDQQDEQVMVEDIEAEEAAAEAEYEAGFNSMFSDQEDDETDTDSDDEDDETDALDASDEDDSDELTDEEEEDPQAALEATLLELSRKADAGVSSAEQLRSIQGKIGALTQQLNAIKTQPTQLTKDTFTGLSQEYPEIAELLSKDLAANLRVKGDIPEEVLNKHLDDVTETVSRKMEVRLLTRAHKDWRSVVPSEGFQTFLASKGAAEVEKFNSVWDADYLADVITEYKDHEAEQEKQRQASAEKTAKQAARMTASAPPKTRAARRRGKTGATTYEEGFQSAFNNR